MWASHPRDLPSTLTKPAGVQTKCINTSTGTTSMREGLRKPKRTGLALNDSSNNSMSRLQKAIEANQFNFENI